MPSIRCSHYQFVLSDPYSEGHLLSANEAAALNNLRAENIRNNLAIQVKKASEGLAPGQLLSQTELARLGLLAAKYDSEYEFGTRRAYTRSSPIESAAREIARAKVTAEARSTSRILTLEELELETSRLSQDPAVQEEARQRISEQERVAAAALESLL